jgi:hypothetical protein
MQMNFHVFVLNIRTVAMFVIFIIQKLFHTECVGTFMIYVRKVSCTWLQ